MSLTFKPIKQNKHKFFAFLQDIFPHIPGDTDYRMFSKDYGDIPGLDIILLLEGYFYHTPYDVPERIVYVSNAGLTIIPWQFIPKFETSL